MTLRKMHAAGTFYPADPSEIRQFCSPYLSSKGELRLARAAVLPHAGYIFSGRTACRTLSGICVPDEVLLMGPDHRGVGGGFSLYSAGEWQTPLGQVKINTELSSRLLECSRDVHAEPAAHASEHSLEVILPMLQIKNQNVSPAPLIVGTLDFYRLREAAEQIGEMLKSYPRDFLTVISNDMNHYEPEDVTRKKDRFALDAILNLDADGLMQAAAQQRVTMCGIGPLYMLLVMKDALRIKRAELVEYTTSAEVSGDTDRVVGYAGFIFT